MGLTRALCILLICFCSLAACKGQGKSDLYRKGLEFRKAGNSQGAIVLFKNALRKDPNFFEARLVLARSYLDLDHLEIAENEFQKVLLQDPGNLDAIIGISEICLQTNRVMENIDRLSEALTEHEGDLRLLNLLGLSYLNLNRFNEAELVFSDALKRDGINVRTNLNLAKLRIAENDYAEARRLLTDSLKLNPEILETRTLLARLLLLDGEGAEALAQYLDVLQFQPKNSTALYLAGLLALDLGDMNRAKSLHASMQQYFPGRSETTRQEGLIDYRQGDYANAIIALQQSLKKRTDPVSIYFLGLSKYQLGQYEQAISLFQAGLDLEPGHITMRVCLAQTLLKKGRIKDCLFEIQKVLQRNPDHGLAHTVLGSAYLAQGDLDLAMDMLERAATLDPGLADAPLKKGIFNLKFGNPLRGEQELVKALNLAPELLNARLILASHYLRQQNFQEAVQLLGSGLTGSVDDALVYNYLAAAWLARNNVSEAVTYLEKAINLAPGYLSPYLNLASLFLSQGQHEKSLQVYQKAFLRHSGNVRLLVPFAGLMELRGEEATALKLFRQAAATGEEAGIAGLVRYLLFKKDPVEALDALEQASRAVETSPLLFELKVAVHRQMGQEEAAVDTLRRWTDLEPESGAPAQVAYCLDRGDLRGALALADRFINLDQDSTLGYCLKAYILMQTGNLAEARRVLAAGLEADPSSLQLKFILADLYRLEDRTDKSEQLLVRIISDYPGFSPAMYALATQKDRSGDKSAARQLYEKTLRIHPRHIPTLNNLAYLLADNYGDVKGALTLAIKAYREMPSSPEIMDTLGYALIKNQRFTEAIPFLEKASESLGDHPLVENHLVTAYEGAGLPEKAIAILNKESVANHSDQSHESHIISEIWRK